MTALRVVKTTKLHWTQRPENKAKVLAMAKRGRRTRKAQKRARTSIPHPETNAGDIPQDTFAYALGYIECWLEAYAKSAGIPSEALAAKLGKVLQVKSRGQ